MTAFKSVDPAQMPLDCPANLDATQCSTSLPADPSLFSLSSPAIAGDFFRAAVLHAGIPVVPLNSMGSILAFNAAAARIFGCNEAQVLGRPLESLVPVEFRSEAARAFQRTIQQRSVNTYELSIVPQGGKHAVHLGVTLSCVIGPDGSLMGVIAWMRDISNRKELEENLTRTRHMASVGTLAAGVAHHFNNIACGMGPMVDFALATEERVDMLKALKMATEACTRIRYITQSLLACSGESARPRYACGNAEDPQAYDCAEDEDLCDLTEELIRFADAVEPTLNQKSIALVLDLQAQRIAAVPRLPFGQVLQHLLQNAVEAIVQCCITTIGAQRQIILRTRSQGDQVMLEFADTGCGIDADDLPHIFDPFFTKKGVQGGGSQNNPGLGLTLVHSVITGMNGHVWADSIPGQGTTLNILIPVVT